MEDQPYQPPKSNVEAVDDKPGSSIKAVLIGILVNTVLSIAVPLVFGIIFGVYLASQGNSPVEIQEYIEADLFSNVYSYIVTISGLLVTTLSAYVVALIAKQKVYRNATIMVAFFYIVILALQLSDPTQMSRTLIFFAVDLLFAWAGAWLYLRSGAR